MTARAAVLRRRYAGAPESLRRALLTASVDPALPRVTRLELRRALDDVDPDPPKGVGVVPFPAVLAGDHDGCVYRAIASDAWRGDLTSAPPEIAATIQVWLRTSFPDLGFEGLHLHLSGPAPGEVWSGRSCELALALAGLSWALDVPPDPQVCATGALGPPGSLSPVDHVHDKAALVARDLPHARLLHPGGAPVDVALDEILPGWRDAREHRAARTLARRAREALSALEAHRHEAALRDAELVLAAAPLDEATRARAAWVRGAALLHLGRGDEGLAHLDAAVTAVPGWETHPDDPPEDLVAEELAAWGLVALVDTGAVRAAYDRGHALLDSLHALPGRSRRWRWVALQIAGSTHRAALALGRFREATELLRTWTLDRAVLADQRARNLGDLAEIHRRVGALPEAREVLRQARAALPDARDPSGLTARFLDLFESRAEAARGRHGMPSRPSGPLWPELGFRLLATRRGGDLASLHALPDVRESMALQWVAGVEVCWHALHDGPGAGVLEALQRDVRRWTVDDPDLADLLRRVADDPGEDDLRALARRCPYG